MGNFRYSIVLEWDEAESVFVATVPALSIGTYGETRLKAIEKAREAIAVTIEGLRDVASRYRNLGGIPRQDLLSEMGFVTDSPSVNVISKERSD